MEILYALGVNKTIFYQFVTFGVVYIFLSQLLFKPYFEAYLERRKRTVGNQDRAEGLLEEAKSLESTFESKAREINDQVRDVYQAEKSKALQSQEEQIQAARLSAKEIVDSNRGQLKSQVEEARKQLVSEAPAISQSIAGQLLGKDLKV